MTTPPTTRPTTRPTNPTVGGPTPRSGPAVRVARGAGQLVGLVDLPLTGVRRWAHRGPALNGPDVLGIRGRRRYQPRPSLFGAAIDAEMSVNIWQAGYFALHRHGRVLPHTMTLGGRTVAEVEKEGHEATRLSELAAVAAAAAHLGESVELSGRGALVLAVLEPSPASGVLDPGDVIVAVAGQPVRTAGEAAAAIAAAMPEGQVAVTALRPDRTGTGTGGPLQVTLHPGTGGGGGRVGLRMATHRPRIDHELDVDIALPADTLGPSLGLMLTLSILDVCTPGELTAGVPVGGTGTVDLHGRVGEVGGVDYKASAAAHTGLQLFLVPPGQAAEARVGAPLLDVVEVATVADAVRVLGQRFGGGRPPA